MAIPFDNNPFVYHAPTPAQTHDLIVLREACKTLYDFIVAKVPASRERALAITNLEQVSMWANKAVVFN